MAPLSSARVAGYRAGIPVYGYVADPAVPAVSVLRFDRDEPGPGRGRPHIHDFPALVYVPRDGGPEGPFAGEVYLLAPGEVVQRPTVPLARADAVAMFFRAEVLDVDGVGRSSWRSHPLLLPFLHGVRGGLLRLRAPEADRPRWERTMAALESELRERRDGYRWAALAHATVLLVEAARLAEDVVGELRRNDEPLLAEVFAVIERSYSRNLSLRDVARAVNLTPGHLTTVVRRRTGRTVGDWITEQRMTSARKLLTETTLPMGEVAGRVGYPDPAYFSRVFRRAHGLSPREWRSEGYRS